jgi:hypothetical protein
MPNPIALYRKRRDARRWAAFKERSGLTDARAAEIVAAWRAAFAPLPSAADMQETMALMR